MAKAKHNNNVKKLTTAQHAQYATELKGLKHTRMLMLGRSRKLAFNEEDGAALKSLNTVITRYEILLGLDVHAELI